MPGGQLGLFILFFIVVGHHAHVDLDVPFHLIELGVVAVEIESVFFVDALDLDIILFFVRILVEEEVFVLRGVSRSEADVHGKAEAEQKHKLTSKAHGRLHGLMRDSKLSDQPLQALRHEPDTTRTLRRITRRHGRGSRAYVVAARGGAPFLSAADGRLLVRWLESGISVARILAAVDEVAEKRRKKRTRGRLTLSACKAALRAGSQARPQSPVPGASLSTYTAALREMTVCSTLEGERQRLIRRIEGIDGALGPEHLATEAVVAVRSFQEAAWNQAQANALRQEADQN